MSQLALSCSFEYLCYGSKAILNIFNSFSAGTVFKRQNLTSNDGPRTERAEPACIFLGQSIRVGNSADFGLHSVLILP